ncbi:MAG TPA: YncE family protein [Thermoanaerobaculia bacterium]
MAPSPHEPRTTIRRRCVLVAALLLALPLAAPPLLAAPAPVAASATATAAPAAAAETAPVPYRRHLEREGVAVDLEIRPLEEAGGFREGDSVAVRLRISDMNTGRPYSSLYPAAWMDRLPDAPEERPDSCQQKVESFVGGTLMAQPELDLNVYYVLALNDDATISVVDPLFGFGSSKLLAMAFLEAPGYDWALSRDQRWLFVSMPAAGKVAVVSTADWKVVESLEVGPDPGRLVVQPDGQYLWVAYRGRRPGARASGVAAIDVERRRVVAHVETGDGDHDLAIDGESLHLFVTNRADGTVSVVDTGELAVVRSVATAADPVSVAWSPVARAAYVSHQAGGEIVAVDAKGEVRARIDAEPGLGQVRFAPDGRLAFVPNPAADVVHIVDASAGRIVQTADVEDGPDQVAFSDELAYVRHRGSDVVLMIPLDEVGREGWPVPVVDFTGGQHPPGLMSSPTPALGIVQAPGATAVLVANPRDRAIYFYKEGMAAPMGQFNNYSRQPRAVQVVDRSLREVEPGVYETAVALRRAGSYDLAFFLDAPRMVHCFDFQVAENPALVAERKRQRQPLGVRYRIDDVQVTAGEEVVVRFELVDPVSGAPRPGLADVEVLTFLVPGIWQKRHRAVESGDGEAAGLYEVRFTPPKPGVFYVFVQSRSQGLGFNASPYATLMASRPAPEGGATP